MKMLLRLLSVTIVGVPFAGAQAITVVNLDSAGEGFNDPTATVSPITGLASTLGADRLACFDAAADVWEAVLDQAVEIRIGANFDPLGGTVMGSTPLGNAGPLSFRRDFAGAPIVSTWYSVAQANQIFGGDIEPGVDDIGATFNSDVDTGAVPMLIWYYGIDGAPPGGTVDFFSTVMHEIGHGLGFLSLVDVNTGAKSPPTGLNDIYSLQLQWGGSGGDTPFMSLTNGQRVSAITSVNELEWIGPRAVADPTFNPSGNPILMFAPSTVNPGSSLSHWDTTNTPNLLMEPFATDAFIDLTLEVFAFQDMQWPLSIPLVSSQSGGGIVFAGDNETLSATVINLGGGETFSWEHNTSPIGDGATGNNSSISGSTTTSMTITNVQSADAGVYELFYNDGGGDIPLTTFSLSVLPAGVPVANWIGLGIAGLLLIAGGVFMLRRQRTS